MEAVILGAQFAIGASVTFYVLIQVSNLVDRWGK